MPVFKWLRDSPNEQGAIQNGYDYRDGIRNVSGELLIFPILSERVIRFLNGSGWRCVIVNRIKLNTGRVS
jgi:hypothetical protein